MKEREQSFTAEAIDHQTTGNSNELAPAENRLVHQIYEFSQAYAQENEQSLERIWTRLRQGQEQSFFPQEKRFFAEGKTMQNHDVQPVDLSQPTMPQSRALLRKPRRVFTLVAALLAAILLVGSALVISTNVHQSKSTLTGGQTATPTHRATGTPATTFIQFPAQNCPDDKTGANLSWHQLCEAGKFVLVNQTIHLKNGQSATIKAAYADRNKLILICDISPASEMDTGCFGMTATTSQGVQMVQEGEINGETIKQHRIIVSGYDTSNLPADLATLTVKISFIISTSAQGKADKVDFPVFSLPLHEARILTPNLIITRDGATFTLSKVVIGASGTHIVFSARNMPFNLYNNGFNAILQTGKQTLTDPDYSLLGPDQPTGFDFLFNYDLSTEHGTWTLTVVHGHASTIPPSSLVFLFNT